MCLSWKSVCSAMRFGLCANPKYSKCEVRCALGGAPQRNAAPGQARVASIRIIIIESIHITSHAYAVSVCVSCECKYMFLDVQLSVRNASCGASEHRYYNQVSPNTHMRFPTF